MVTILILEILKNLINMKKQLTFLFILIILSINSYSQLTLQYRACSNCNTTNTVYDWEAVDIASDFGMRISSSIWHRGVDYGKSSNTDYGYHLITPVNGTVEKIYVFSSSTHYKILSIRDNTGNNHFGYGHIFDNSDPLTSSPFILGDFILYKFLYLGEYHYAIINTLTNVAISDINGYSFTYNLQPYITTNQVTAGQEIAPLGGSGGFMNDLQHLHLYRFVNPSESINDIQDKDNCKDPLQILDNIYTYYNTSLETVNITEISNNTFYSGANKSVVKVRCSMINPGQSGWLHNYHYSNAIMDIDDVDLKIKKSCEDDSEYSLIHGKNYLSKISHGARWGGNPYPNIAPDEIREEYGVYSTDASNCKIGIIPGAYYKNGAYDEFVFTDFYTRIHKTQNLNGTLTLAENPDDALYNDGEYNIRADITTVKGSQQNSISPTNIKIDNFCPYIKEVAVYKGAMNDVNLVYRGKWNAIGSTLSCTPEGTRYCYTGAEILIKVETSEPLKENSLNLEIDIEGQLSPLYLTPYYSNLEKTLFFFKIEGSQTQNIYFIPSKKAVLKFNGLDLADNQLEAIPTGADISQQYQVKIRQDANTWQPAANPGTDSFHWFKFGCVGVNKSGKSISDNEECLEADFYAAETTVNIGEDIVLNNISTGNFTNVNFKLYSSDGSYNNEVLLYEPYIFNRDITGYYDVELMIIDDDGHSSTEIKYNYIQVVNPSVTEEETIVDFNAFPTNTNIGDDVQFTDLSTGNPTNWKWYKDKNGSEILFSTEQNPNNDISYNPNYGISLPGTYNIRLEVSFDGGVSWESKTKLDYITVNSIDDQNVICDVSEQCNLGDYASFDIELENYGNSPSNLYTYNINYGDGQTSSVQTSQPTYYNTHVYNSVGQKNYTIKVYSQLGDEIGSCIGTIEVFDITAPINVSCNITPTEPVLNQSVLFSCTSNAIDPIYYSWVLKRGNNQTVGGASSQAFAKMLTSSGNYTAYVTVTDMSGRYMGTSSVNFDVPEPNNCIVASIETPSCIRNYHGYTFTSNSFFRSTNCISYDNSGNYQIYDITDIRWTVFNKSTNTQLNTETHFDSNGNFPKTFHHNSFSGDDYYVYLEVWNRYAHMDAYPNFSPYTTNENQYDYYDKIRYFLSTGSNSSDTKYICDNSVDFWPFNINYKIFVAGSNCDKTIETGETKEYKATEEITLRDGFTAEEGCDFTARIECSGMEWYEFNGYFNNPNPINNDSINSIEMKVYPNPTNSNFSINISDIDNNDCKIYIYNIYGNLIKNIQNPKYFNEINFEEQAPGIYFIKYLYKDKSLTKKIIITR